MKNSNCLLALGSLLVLFVASGSSCRGWHPGPAPIPPPQILPPQATLPQLIQTVNENRAKIQTVSSDQVTVGVAGMPSLKANLAVGGERDLRLQAGTMLTGEELDIGSNQELFWLWIKRNEPKGVFYCRHDQFANSAVRQMFPVRPEWIASALGLVYLDPAGQHQGPFITPESNYEIRSVIHDGADTFHRVTVLEPRSGWVVQQRLYDSRQTLLASANMSLHTVDPTTTAVLPREVRIRWPATNMDLQLSLHNLQVNPPNVNPALFALPQINGYQQVDLGSGVSPLTVPASQPRTSYVPPPVQPRYVQPAAHAPGFAPVAPLNVRR